MKLYIYIYIYIPNTKHQNQALSNIYKTGRKLTLAECHLKFLRKELEMGLIPKCFQIKQFLPGNKKKNQDKLNKVSIEIMQEEVTKHEQDIEVFTISFEKSKLTLQKVFEPDKFETTVVNVERHLKKISNDKENIHMKKIQRDQNSNVNLVNSDQTFQVSNESYVNVNIENINMRPKKKRKFKRKYLQPQPKRARKRKKRHNDVTLIAEDGEWDKIVKNITGTKISNAELSLFSKGMKFCPVELDPPILRMQKELLSFYRNLRIKWVFRNKSDSRTLLEKQFYENSDWSPPKACLEIENFILRIQEYFDKWKPPQRLCDNLSKEERDFMNHIRSDHETVYMWEDKGPSFTKMTREQYLDAGKAELNKPNYEKVDEDPTDDIAKQIKGFVNKLFSDGQISEKIMSYLLNGDKKLSKFYHLLKTHKIPLDIENPAQWLEDNGYPVRGIIAGCGSPTERLAGFVDFFLQPGMSRLPSFLRDTKHTLQQIEDINHKIDIGDISLDNVNLASLDVVSMYPNMSDELGISACKDYLDTRDFSCIDEELQIASNNIIDSLKLCIKNNYFNFDGDIFKVCGGVGTGIKLAPPYACIGMGKYEQIVFESNNDLVQLILEWKRFIDDVFMLFRGSKEQCAKLVTWLNSIMPGVINFTYDFSETKIQFLDIEIFKDNGRLSTKLFIKPTNLQLYLDFNSNHPLHCKKGIVFGQALRVIERCSREIDTKNNLENLKLKLMDRNYPEFFIEEQFSRALKFKRVDLINQPRRATNTNQKIRLIFTNNTGGPPLHKWFRESKHLLARNDEAKEFGEKLQIAFRQPKNLKQICCGVKKCEKRQNSEISGCFTCKKCKVACPILVESKSFTSTNTGRTYPIKEFMNCNSDLVIYLATCKKCRGQYVGKSKTQFKTRHSNHKQEIKRGYGGLGHHYGGQKGCGYENLSIQLIEKCENPEILATRETFWQHQIRAYVQNGGKAHCYRKDI